MLSLFSFALLSVQASAQIPAGWQIYPRVPYGDGLPGNASFPIDALKLNQTNPNGLATSSAGQCAYIEQQFLEDFRGPLNLTRWLPTGSVAIPTNQKPTTYGTTNYWTVRPLAFDSMTFRVYNSLFTAVGSNFVRTIPSAKHCYWQFYFFVNLTRNSCERTIVRAQGRLVPPVPRHALSWVRMNPLKDQSILR